MDWFGGKPAGCTRLVNGSYQVIFPHGTKSFSKSTYGTRAEAKDAAEEWRYNKSMNQGLTKNLICINEKDREPYLEVELQSGLVMKCDTEHINIVEDSVWSAWQSKGGSWFVKRQASKKTGQSHAMFHKLAFPYYKVPKHINGDGLDNRSINVYDDSKPRDIVQSNNKSGVTGVYKSGNEWNAQIKSGGKSYKKSFMISKYGEEEAYYMAVQQRTAWDEEFNSGKDMTRKYKNFVSKLEALDVETITTLEEYLTSLQTEKYPKLTLECPAKHQFSLGTGSLYNKLSLIKKNPNVNICVECEKPEMPKEEKAVQEACEELGFTFYSYEKNTRDVIYKCKCGSISKSHATNLTRPERQAQCSMCQNDKFTIKTDAVRGKLQAYDCELIGEYVNTHTPIEYKCVCEAIIKIRYCQFITGKRCRHCGYGVLCEHNIYLSECNKCSSSVCEHNKYYRNCERCGKDVICEHAELRTKCVPCNPQFACKHCGCYYVSKTSKFKPYCFRCHCILNPDAYIPVRYKFKEHYLDEYLESVYPDVTLVFDKTLGACSRRRPDIFIECYTHCIVIECDENQHKSYDSSCENKRMMELFQDVGFRPIIFIRFNPDSYKKNDLKVESCFKRDATGILRTNKTEWNTRTKLLKKTIDQHIDNIPDKECTVIRLFYDQ